MENRPMSFILGIIALVADLLGILTFIVSGKVSSFWSATWLVMIVSIGLLLGIALYFLNAANSQKSYEFLPLASGTYALLSCIAVLCGLYALGADNVSLSTYSGICILIAFPALMALLVSKMSQKKAHRAISYFYAATGILAIIGLMIRYLDRPDFSWAIVGELVILLGISVCFLIFSKDA